MSVPNTSALLETIPADARVLVIGEPDPQVTVRFSQLEQIPWDDLPDAEKRYPLICCRYAAHLWLDAFDLVQRCAGLLDQNGWLLIEDITVPDDERAAYYVEAFYHLRAGKVRRFYAGYAWEGMLLDAGLQPAWSETNVTRLVLSDWAADSSPAVVQRLQILLKQAPGPVRDWWHPAAVGSAEASFDQHKVIIAGQLLE